MKSKEEIFGTNTVMPMPVQSGEDEPHIVGSDAKVEHYQDLHWYAAYTNVHHEKAVARQIQGRLLSCFLPLYRSSRRWKDRHKELELPLFPGYVFVRMKLSDRLTILSIPGVVHIVSCRGTPSPLPDLEVELLRTQLLAGARIQPHPYIRAGKRVRVRSGPFVGLRGIVTRRKDKLRVVLSIESIMRSVAVEIDEADIEAAA